MKVLFVLGVFVLVTASVSLLACSGGGAAAQPTGPGTTTGPDAQGDATVDDGASSDAGAEAVIADASEAGVTDAGVPDGECPATFPPACRAGQTCILARCNLCVCQPDAGTWACTAKFCPVQGDP